ncbi:MAG: hypothetical protein AB9866_04590 [Syntrophobacteraceae bacterium]
MAGPRKTRVAIICCGMIADQHADQHADQQRHLPGCELVAACDTDELMAGSSICHRFQVWSKNSR